MKLASERDATEWVWAAKALAVVSAWSGLGLFDRMKQGPVRPSELGLDARAVATTLPVLIHVGLVSTDGDQIALTHSGERLLREGALPTDRNLDTLRDLGRMKDVLQKGGPVLDDRGQSKGTTGGTRADDLDHTERFLDMLYRSSEGAAKTTFDWLKTGLPKGGAVLDLGGGHGRYARSFADAGHPTTLFDLPHVVGLAKKRHGDALHYREGDFHTTADFGGPYDAILLCNVVHGESPEANASLVSRLAGHLRPGGRLVLKDMFLDELSRDPENAVFFGLTMLFYTEQGRSPSLVQARRWFSAAGLGEPQVVLLDTQQLVIGKKP